MNKMFANKWFSLAIILIAPFVVVADLFLSSTVLPAIKREMHASDAVIELIIAAYFLGYAVFLITGARMGDHFGRKKMFRIGMLSFITTSALCAISVSPYLLIFFRFIEGVSAAIMMSQSIALMQVTFREGQERNRAFGTYGMAAGMACVVGFAMGSVFASQYFGHNGWRLAFVLDMPLGIATFLLSGKGLKETERSNQLKFDIAGTIFLSLGLIAFVFPIIVGRESGWPVWSFFSIAFSIALMVAFIFHQKNKLRNDQNPLININLFRISVFNVGILTVLFFFRVHNSFILMESIYIQNGLKLLSWSAGQIFIFYGFGFIISAYLSIRYIGRYGKRMLQFGLAVMIVALSLQLQFLSMANGNTAILKLILLLYGLGQGLVMPSLLNIAMKSIPHHMAGLATGVYSTMQQVASTLGITFIGGLFFFEYHIASVDKYATAFTYGLYADIAYLAISMLLLQRIEPGTKKVMANIPSSTACNSCPN